MTNVNNLDKYDISYQKIKFLDKVIYLFVNHKTAVLCWNQIHKNANTDIITFDSHSDFHGGLINSEHPNLAKYLRGKFLPNTYLEHFSTSSEFIKWNLSDDYQNKRFIIQEHKFLLYTNDNFIDVAFMKNIIQNVFSYYISDMSNFKSGKCDDINGTVHTFKRDYIKHFKNIKGDYILDLDLDLFAYSETLFRNFKLFSVEMIKKWIPLILRLISSEKCIGITIALEPSFCGSYENCLILCNYLSNSFKVDIATAAKTLLNTYV